MRLESLIFKTLIGVIALVAVMSCSEKKSADSSLDASKNSLSSQQLAQRGRSVYMTHCIACHNVDPKKEGSVGPAVHGSSFELLSARVLKASYPAGYQPRRKSHMMRALPELENDIGALHEFLK